MADDVRRFVRRHRDERTMAFPPPAPAVGPQRLPMDSGAQPAPQPPRQTAWVPSGAVIAWRRRLWRTPDTTEGRGRRAVAMSRLLPVGLRRGGGANPSNYPRPRFSDGWASI